MIEAINSLIVRFVNGRFPVDLKSWAVRHQALPIVFDMGGCFALRPSGNVISFSWDEPGECRTEEDERIRNLVFAEAAQKYIELRPLAPVRSDDAATCPFCEGAGRPVGLTRQITNIGCYCGGLGWIPRRDRYAGHEPLNRNPG